MDTETVLAVSEACDQLAGLLAEIAARREPDLKPEAVAKFASGELFMACQDVIQCFCPPTLESVAVLSDEEEEEILRMLRAYDGGRRRSDA